MLERRIARRRRVAIEGTVACPATGSTATVRIRNLSARGAEIVVPDDALASPELELIVEGAAVRRRARVVWRRVNRFGLEFAAAVAGSAAAEGTALPATVRGDAPPSLLDGLLAARRAGRG